MATARHDDVLAWREEGLAPIASCARRGGPATPSPCRAPRASSCRADRGGAVSAAPEGASIANVRSMAYQASPIAARQRMRKRGKIELIDTSGLAFAPTIQQVDLAAVSAPLASGRRP